MKLPIEIREADDSDLGFVLDSWGESFRNSKWGLQFPTDEFHRRHRNLRAYLAVREPLQVACAPDDRWQVIGWICGTKDLLHFLYVKLELQGYGVGSALLRHLKPSHTLNVTHCTDAFLKRFGRKYRIIQDPYLLIKEISNG